MVSGGERLREGRGDLCRGQARLHCVGLRAWSRNCHTASARDGCDEPGRRPQAAAQRTAPTGGGGVSVGCWRPSLFTVRGRDVGYVPPRGGLDGTSPTTDGVQQHQRVLALHVPQSRLPLGRQQQPGTGQSGPALERGAADLRQLNPAATGDHGVAGKNAVPAEGHGVDVDRPGRGGRLRQPTSSASGIGAMRQVRSPSRAAAARPAVTDERQQDGSVR